MLAVFESAIGRPPKELGLGSGARPSLNTRENISEHLPNDNFLAVSHEDESLTQARYRDETFPFKAHEFGVQILVFIDTENICDTIVTPFHLIWFVCIRSLVVMDEIFCIFTGILNNTCDLRRHYGLSRQATEAMVVVEAYRVLRDRAPYPPDQVIRDLDGKFAFILFDAKASNLFLARDRGGSVQLHWGMAGDGSLVCSDDPKIIAEACGKCYTPFPPGCIFLSGNGLISFDHPLHKVKAILREDDQGEVSAVIFQVDLYTKLRSIPRTGSAANWANVAVVEGE
ncbi:hypothetical protein RJ639_014135 [Escallonia herrerae]|uniref:DUF3700 domain-containing protein n=1 Tax=Escallonia herrerae TaxID=1293975 RepID=A0AA88VI80_9ASTE|nr:hypothetical protein RJ639_014135 [Escallonia herrerae]